MKIGLLTVPFNNNFGGFLQAYALKTVLTQFGHEVIIINRRRNRSRSWKGRIKSILIGIGILRDTDKILSANTKQFVKKYLTPGTPYYYSSKALRKCLEYKFDYFIVGSDQVWRYKYAQDSIDDFFFSFLKNQSIPRMSYAASFGIDYLDYPLEKIHACSSLLRLFSHISVREDSGVEVLEKLGVIKEEVSVVLDPTLLLTKQFYFDTLIKNYSLEKTEDKYVCDYILDDSLGKKQISNHIAKSIGGTIIQLRAQTGDVEQLKPIVPVEEWLSRIYYSDFVVTDSFHGTIFSILFNKPFIVMGNTTRGLTRIKSLLNTFGLDNRMILSKEDFTKELIIQPIDWLEVNKTLDSLQRTSIDYLNKSLN